MALNLASLLDGEIISADSRQVYRHLDIGTAKPTPSQRARVRHYFIDELELEQNFSAGEFGKRGRLIISDIINRKRTPIVVGGSGLYLRSLIDGLFEGPGADKEFRAILEQQVSAGEVNALIEELRRIDPKSAARADPSKPRRIIRALEVYHATGKSLSSHQQEHKVLIEFTPVMFGLDWHRSMLYKRIDQRCDDMITRGLLQEVEDLERRGYDESSNALNTVGYAEALAYRRGKIAFEEMVRLFKQNSRRYAKRQLTWFRRDTRIRWIRVDQDRRVPEIAQEIARLFASA